MTDDAFTPYAMPDADPRLVVHVPDGDLTLDEIVLLKIAPGTWQIYSIDGDPEGDISDQSADPVPGFLKAELHWTGVDDEETARLAVQAVSLGIDIGIKMGHRQHAAAAKYAIDALTGARDIDDFLFALDIWPDD